jgi:hypothetical protein
VDDDVQEDLGVYRDADLQQAALERVGRRMAQLRRQGVCTHGSAVGHRHPPHSPEQHGLDPGQLRCTAGCRRVFASDADWAAAIAAALA